MKRTGFALLLLALAGFSPTGAAAEIEDSIQLQLDPDQLFVVVRERLTEDDASDMREEIDDQYGNKDGYVTSAEQERYNLDNTIEFTQNREDCFTDFDLARIEGKTPLRISAMRDEAAAATGSVTSTAPVLVSSWIIFQYPPAPDEVEAVVRFSEFASFGEAIGCYVGGAYSTYYPYPFAASDAAGHAVPIGVPPLPAVAGEAADDQAADGDAKLMIQPYGSATSFDKGSFRPTSVQSLWDGVGLSADTDPERNLLYSNAVTFTVNGVGSAEDASGPNAGETVRDVGAVIGYATVGVGVVGVGLALTTEFFRYQAFKWLVLVPGFTRIEKDEVLEHGKRDELYRFIKDNPGPSFSDLRRELELSNGTLVHHLRILEAQEFVKPVRDGFRTRFYVRGPKIVPQSYLTRTQQTILDVIGSNPGLTQKQLSQVLGLPRESVSYHTKRLAAAGRVQIRQEGKWRKYFPPATPAPGASVSTA